MGRDRPCACAFACDGLRTWKAIFDEMKIEGVCVQTYILREKDWPRTRWRGPPGTNSRWRYGCTCVDIYTSGRGRSHSHMTDTYGERNQENKLSYAYKIIWHVKEGRDKTFMQFCLKDDESDLSWVISKDQNIIESKGWDPLTWSKAPASWKIHNELRAELRDPDTWRKYEHR